MPDHPNIGDEFDAPARTDAHPMSDEQVLRHARAITSNGKSPIMGRLLAIVDRHRSASSPQETVIAAARWYDAQLTALEAAAKGHSRIVWSERQKACQRKVDDALVTLRGHVANLPPLPEPPKP